MMKNNRHKQAAVPLTDLSAKVLAAAAVAVRKAVKENQQLRRKRTAGQVPAANKGLTLIELLIVISIMVMLVAVSVPTFKPMLESRRTKNAADAVAAVLQTARFKAMQEQMYYGVEFIKYPDTENVCLQMRMIKPPGGGAYQAPGDVRVVVADGNIYLYKFDGSGWISEPLSDADWVTHAAAGLRIRFGDQGRSYRLDTLTALSDKITLPQGLLPGFSGGLLPAGITPMTFQIMQPPRQTLVPPDVVPQGTIVDLAFSGGFTDGSEQSFAGGNASVLFSPAGYVEEFFNKNGYVPNDSNTYGGYVPNGGLIYLCVGEWDRQSDAAGQTLAEDGKTNLRASTTYWVTIHPRTGQIRTAKNGFEPTTLEQARKYASEHYNGGE
ncbi:MAG: prepilin-type N-terminal cleavage/methylation domain-containing protein [Planctomycetaceae bacterium]|jgi:prepilin-type N-terminal cleavage/methylation domain-containing protein|nr:prepilin-type N-terminal cleavage/methylation domain-containing protein [Planctomycetaceae bacterium]